MLSRTAIIYLFHTQSACKRIIAAKNHAGGSTLIPLRVTTPFNFTGTAQFSYLINVPEIIPEIGESQLLSICYIQMVDAVCYPLIVGRVALLGHN